MSGNVAVVGPWAKSGRDPLNPEPTGWLPLHQHLDDAAAVAGALVDHWVPAQVLDRLAADVPGGIAGVRTLVSWLAAVHDVGKASPAFAVQVPQLCGRLERVGLRVDGRLATDPNRSAVRHEVVGALAVRQWWSQHLGPDDVRDQLAMVVACHHGTAPSRLQLHEASTRTDLLGRGAEWSAARHALLDRATAVTGAGPQLTALSGVALSQPTQVLLTALVIVADWIASDETLFALRPLHTVEDEPEPLDEEAAARETAHRFAEAWPRLRLPDPWRARSLGPDLDAALAARFGLEGATARPVQRATVEAVRRQDRPGLVVVEAPMGEGKTEAALLAAEELAARSGAGGCFVALPTQATSDAMFTRVLRWVDALPAGGGRSMFLAHGKSVLNEEFQGLRAAPRFVGIGESGDDEAIAHRWFSGRKRGVLADFVVGTVDQVLFTALKSKHVVLRHLALAGKVVIIDEVHAYDVYMSRYLDRALHWLGAYGVPVVLLSATLPSARRAELVLAYQSGRGGDGGELPATLDYPLVLGSDGAGAQVVPAAPRAVRVLLDHLPDDLDTLVGYLREHLADGGCALVVRNTVGRVQETAERLEAELGADQVTIDHSRFLACDRARIDRSLLDRFGPSGDDRPARHVVVASQVVEQSLDVDFDLLVTDLAPTDLVLQRLGRVHRHERERPPGLVSPRCALVGVEDWAADPVRAVRGSRAVYGEHVLLRSAALLRAAARTEIALPQDIPELVQTAYGDGPLGPPAWQAAMTTAAERAQREDAQRRENASTFLLRGAPDGPGTLDGFLDAGVGEVDDDARGAAQVRDSGETLEVLVVQRDAEGGLQVPDWVRADSPVPTDLPVDADQARTLLACSLRLPLALTHPGVIDDVIGTLEATVVHSFQATPVLRGQLVLVLEPDRTAVLRRGKLHVRLTYDTRRGLRHEQC